MVLLSTGHSIKDLGTVNFYLQLLCDCCFAQKLYLIDSFSLCYQDDEDPDDWRRKRQGYAPGLVVTRNGAIVVLGKEIFLIFNEDELVKAVVAFLASFCLLDLDYPTNWLISLSILQRLIFNDIKVHPGVNGDVVKALEDFTKYCT